MFDFVFRGRQVFEILEETFCKFPGQVPEAPRSAESSFCSASHLATKRSSASSASEREMSESEIFHFFTTETLNGKKWLMI